MPKIGNGLVVIEMSMSLDGFIAGPDDGPEHRLGTHGGEKVFDWYATGEESYPAGSFFKAEGANRAVVDQMFARFGAFVSGRRTYDLAEGWNGTHPCNGVPVFILTHHPDPNPPQGESDLVFVTDGIESAIAQARKAAKGKDVALLGRKPRSAGTGGGAGRRDFHPRFADPDRRGRSDVREFGRRRDRARAGRDDRRARGGAPALPRAPLQRQPAQA
jgi:dihydrofolate reductase